MALKQTTTRDYLIFLLLTGLRKNEAATLRWTDVDLEARTITIRAECTKNKQEHCLPLTDFLILMLNQRVRPNAVVVLVWCQLRHDDDDDDDDDDHHAIGSQQRSCDQV